MVNKIKKNSHIWEKAEHQYYIENYWCDQALFRDIAFEGSIYDPACGSGSIVKAAIEAGYYAFGSDIVKRSEYCETVISFYDVPDNFKFDNIVCNPPYGKDADKFLEKALHLARKKVAFLLPGDWSYGDSRSKYLEHNTPFVAKYEISPRPSMPSGYAIEAGTVKVGNGTKNYAWYIWDNESVVTNEPKFGWIHKNKD